MPDVSSFVFVSTWCTGHQLVLLFQIRVTYVLLLKVDKLISSARFAQLAFVSAIDANDTKPFCFCDLDASVSISVSRPFQGPILGWEYLQMAKSPASSHNHNRIPLLTGLFQLPNSRVHCYSRFVHRQDQRRFGEKW